MWTLDKNAICRHQIKIQKVDIGHEIGIQYVEDIR